MFFGAGLFPAAAEPTTDDEDDSEIVMPAGKDTTTMSFLELRGAGLRMARATFALNESREDIATTARLEW